MKKSRVENENDVNKLVTDTLAKYPDLIQTLSMGTGLFRVQPSEFDESPAHYNADSDTRFAHPQRKIGVCYLGLSDAVAVAESFQSGQGVDNQAVPYSKLEQSSLHLLNASRDLRLVDAAALANRATHQKLRDLVAAKGQGREGYIATQALSGACMAIEPKVDGLLYHSAVYTVTGSLNGCNVVLFADRGTQVEPVSHQPILKAELSTGETALELLESLGEVIE